jgi:hypothetical protein
MSFLPGGNRGLMSAIVAFGGGGPAEPTFAAALTSGPSVGSATSVLVALTPSTYGLQAGDLIIVFVTGEGSTGTWTWPAGWSKIWPLSGSSDYSCAWKTWDGSETSVTVTCSVSRSNRWGTAFMFKDTFAAASPNFPWSDFSVQLGFGSVTQPALTNSDSNKDSFNYLAISFGIEYDNTSTALFNVDRNDFLFGGSEVTGFVSTATKDYHHSIVHATTPTLSQDGYANGPSYLKSSANLFSFAAILRAADYELAAG